MPSEPSSPFRRYSFRCDGVPHSTAFYHTPGLTPEAQTPHLEMQFNVWLELTYPGCRAAGRISHIAFTDEEHFCGEPPPDTPGLWVGP